MEWNPKSAVFPQIAPRNMRSLKVDFSKNIHHLTYWKRFSYRLKFDKRKFFLAVCARMMPILYNSHTICISQNWCVYACRINKISKNFHLAMSFCIENISPHNIHKRGEKSEENLSPLLKEKAILHGVEFSTTLIE